MIAPKHIIKSTGDTQRFSQQKLLRSLRRAGVNKKLAQDILKQILQSRNITTTEDIHRQVYRQLKKTERPLAAKYNLKRAIMDLGPSGYPFEQFIGRLLIAKGYHVSTNRIIRGSCVSHEIDVLGRKDDKHFIFECKFHNRGGYKSDVQTVLYMQARYTDITSRWERLEHRKDLHKVWVITNTNFTAEARRYAQCVGMGLMAWRYPAGHSLVELIEETGLHPITAITSMSKKQKTYLITHGLVVCRDAQKKRHIIERAGVRGKKLERVLHEAQAICGCVS